MKISQLLQVVLVSVFVTVPGMAASVPSDAPVSLCGDKAEKAETTLKDDKKSDKKNDKKESKEEKSGTKGSA